MGVGKSKPEEENNQSVITPGATAPSISEEKNGPGLPMVGGKRRKTRSRKARKSRKGKRHGRK